MDEMKSSGVKVLSATIHEQSLEDVFIHYTGQVYPGRGGKEGELLFRCRGTPEMGEIKLKLRVKSY